MTKRRADILAAGVGVALAFVLVILVSASTPIVYGPDNLTPIAHVLWMHAQTPGTSGNHSWYNFTVTLNRSIPLTGLAIGFVNRQGDTVLPPPTFDFTVFHGSSPIASFNLTTRNWSAGASQDLVGGDWFGIQITNQDLAGDKLVVIGVGGQFSSTCSMEFP